MRVHKNKSYRSGCSPNEQGFRRYLKRAFSLISIFSSLQPDWPNPGEQAEICALGGFLRRDIRSNGQDEVILSPLKQSLARYERSPSGVNLGQDWEGPNDKELSFP